MDRVAFLRSLNFLRPLPPGAWDNVNDDDEPYSGSTITPPTPSKNNVIVLFEESLFAVSIEPSTLLCPHERNNDVTAESGNEQTCSRKRGRGEDFPATNPKCFAIGPAFFQHHSTETTQDASPPKTTTSGVEDAMDAEPEHDAQKLDGNADEAELKRQINYDPSLCTFEAAIMKKLPSSLLGDDPVQDGAFATPKGHRHPTSHERDAMESKVLIFRFGNRFVFQVDESAIVELKYEPGHDGGVSDEGQPHVNTDGDGMNSKHGGDASPPPKRQRNGGDNSSHLADKASVKTKRLPPSLTITFGSCTFRVFSLEGKSDNKFGPNTSTPTDRIWGALAKTVESVERRIMKARTALMQHFEIENTEKKKSSQSAPHSWKMAPPGSGLAFQSWPESFEGSSFHSNTLKCKASTFWEEDWSHCLGKRGTIPSTISSPQKSSSTSKTSCSSTRFEQGQTDHTPSKDGSRSAKNGEVGKTDSDEKNDAPNHSSELTHETEQHDKDDCAPLQQSPASLFQDPGRNSRNSQAINGGGVRQPGGDDKKTKEDEVYSQGDNVNPNSWKVGIYRKYHNFGTSAIHMEKAMHSEPMSPQRQKNVATKSHLTLCAASLSNSYLTANEFLNSSQQCENVIEDVTSEMEGVLDRMFPARALARGRKSNAVDSGQSEDFQVMIEKLMTSRKEAVAMKFALLMTPKR